MNKPFVSFLRDKFEAYINYRINLGYTEKNIRLCLSYLDDYIKDNAGGLSMFTPSFFLEFRKTLNVSPKTVNCIITVIRGFFFYLERNEEYEVNPLLDITPLKELPFIPFVFSESQVELFLNAVQKRIRKDKRYFLNDLAQYIAMLLLVRCGLRISEPTGLLLKNYCPQEGSIYIEKTKFKKDRLLPIPETLVRELENYLAVRKVLLIQDQNPYLLATGADKKITRTQLYPVFNKAVKDIGLVQKRQTIANTTFGRPTPHSLRHSFAVNTLKRIKEQGKSAQNALPILSAYMGHRYYTDTAVYLKVVDANQRLQLVNFAKTK